MTSSKDLVQMNRTIKDSVFTDLFSDVKNAARLVQALHPEYGEIKDSELSSITLSTILVKQVYNDFAVLYDDKAMIFVEEQSTYNPNIGLRLFLYSQKTVQQWLDSISTMNIYSTKKMSIPELEFYCVCTYEKKETYPEFETFGNRDGFLFCRVKMLYPNTEGKTIISEYVKFSQGVTVIQQTNVSKAQKVEMLSKYIDECIENGILEAYLKVKKREVIDMVDVLFDPEFVIERMLFEEKAEARAEGKAEGREEGRAEGREEGRAEGRAEGREEGRAEGRAEGKTVGKLEANCKAVNNIMSKYQLTFDEAVTVLGLDEQETKLISKMMKPTSD